MKLWIARNKSGLLYLSVNKPKLMCDEYYIGKHSTLLEFDNFPEVTFENSPQQVEIKFSITGMDRGHRDSIIRGLKQLEKDYMISYEEEIEWLNKLVK